MSFLKRVLLSLPLIAYTVGAIIRLLFLPCVSDFIPADQVYAPLITQPIWKLAPETEVSYKMLLIQEGALLFSVVLIYVCIYLVRKMLKSREPA